MAIPPDTTVHEAAIGAATPTVAHSIVASLHDTTVGQQADTTAHAVAAIGALLGRPAALDDIRNMGGGPFLDIPLAQLPHLPEISLPGAPAPPTTGPAPGAGPTPGTPQTPGAPATPQPQLPPMPANPVDMLLHGLPVPALPGVDQLMQPLVALAKSFGTGKFPSGFNPVDGIRQGTQVIDETMQTASQALGSLSEVWQGQAASAAQNSGSRGTAHGGGLGTQGRTISDITDAAADSVGRGYQQLAGIVQDFAVHATLLGPQLLDPLGQMALATSAAQHLAAAQAVVGVTQTELGGLGADIAQAGGLIQVLLNSGINPATVASEVLSIAEPVVSQMGDTITNVAEKTSGTTDSIDGSTSMLGSGFDRLGPGNVNAAAVDTAGFGGSTGFGSGFENASFGGGPNGTAPPGPLPGASLGPGAPQIDSAVGATSAAAASTPGSTGGAMSAMAPGHPAARGGDTHHSRNAPQYQRTQYDPTEGMGPVAPAVLGADDPEHDSGYTEDPEPDSELA